MIAFIKERSPKGWRFYVELLSASGKEGFYEKLGFEKRPLQTCGQECFDVM